MNTLVNVNNLSKNFSSFEAVKEINFSINENEILDISLENKVEVTILDEKVNGTIDYISPISDPETKTFEIVVKVENKDLRYKDGLSSIISIVKGNVLAHKISPSILALGDSGELGVKVIGFDNRGKIKLSMKELKQKTEKNFNRA